MRASGWQLLRYATKSVLDRLLLSRIVKSSRASINGAGMSESGVATASAPDCWIPGFQDCWIRGFPESCLLGFPHSWTHEILY